MLVHQAKRLNSPCCLVVNHDAQNMPKMKIRSDDKDDQGNDKESVFFYGDFSSNLCTFFNFY